MQYIGLGKVEVGQDHNLGGYRKNDLDGKLQNRVWNLDNVIT
jgi:hypothetical protein